MKIIVRDISKLSQSCVLYNKISQATKLEIFLSRSTIKYFDSEMNLIVNIIKTKN